MEYPVNPPARVTINLGEDGVAQVRLIRADKMNALDPDMFAALLDAGRVLRALKGLRCVVLSGEGRSFCAGLDMSSMADSGRRRKHPLTTRTHGNTNPPQEVALQWRNLSVPVIAAVHGVCFGGGLQIASGADIRVMTPDARLAVMELKWGLVPDMAGYALWRGMVRDDHLRELTYTNREFNGTEALAAGFATIIDADPLARATAIAADIANHHPQAQRAAKRLFGQYLYASVDEILMAESVEQQALMGTPNQIEAVMSQFQKRTGAFVDD